MDEATRIIVARARTYWKPAHLRDKVILQVWSKQIMDLRKLVKKFGGNYYTHKAGFVYQLSKDEDLLELTKEILKVNWKDPEILDQFTRNEVQSSTVRFTPLLAWARSLAHQERSIQDQ